jgi:CHASE3 domain sensor protein
MRGRIGMRTLLKTKRLGWAVIFVIVTVMGLIAHLSGRRYLAAVQAVEHTLSVKSAISGTLSLLKDAETGQRGFILTGDEQFLEPYRARASISRPCSLASTPSREPTQRRMVDCKR